MSRTARDNARTPVQWDGTAHGGFTTGTPWMRTNDSYTEINVKSQQGDKNSVLRFWKRMLKLRKEWCDVFTHGSFEMFDMENLKTVVYTKTFKGVSFLVVLNFSGEKEKVVVPEGLQTGEVLVANVEGGDEAFLEPWEGRVYRVL